MAGAFKAPTGKVSYDGGSWSAMFGSELHKNRVKRSGDVEIRIDYDDLIRYMVSRALRSRTGKSTSRGHITVIVTNRKEEKL